MSRIVALSNPVSRNNSSAASRIFRLVSSALAVGFAGGINLNVFKLIIRPGRLCVKNYFEHVQNQWETRRSRDTEGSPMKYRQLGRTPWRVSEISFGAWAIGGAWGSVDDAESLDALRAAVDCGVNFIDTADVYGMGRSERLIAQLRRERKHEIVV